MPSNSPTGKPMPTPGQTSHPGPDPKARASKRTRAGSPAAQVHDSESATNAQAAALDVGSSNAVLPSSAMQSREDRIRLAAYFAAERRGFAPGQESEDWIAAEQEVDAAETPAANDGKAT